MKNLSLRSALKLSVFGCLLISSLSWGQDSAQQTAPDNTKMNKGDTNTSQPTADRQKDNPSDRDITQQIRKSITLDKSLSTYAHNVKIIAQNGVVTLKGQVRSDDEKHVVEQKAAEIVGKDKVTSELAVKPKQ